MGLQQFERRLERLVEGAFAKAFRSGLQPVEIGRRLTREMDLHRTLAPRGTIAPNAFTVALSPEDHDRFAAIEEELIDELISVADDHAKSESYLFLGPVTVALLSDTDLASGRLLVSGEIAKSDGPTAVLRLSDGRRLPLGAKPLSIGRLPECDVVVADANASRRHAEVRPGNQRNTWEVADLGSTNGTRLNGVPVTSPTTLRPGDQIAVGATVISFESA